MYKLIAGLMLLGCSFSSHAQSFNQSLADSLGADERGMKMYVFVILKTGENNTTDKTIRDSLFRGHMNNIGRLADMGKLIVAGPFEKNPQQYRGLFILNVKNIAEAKEIVETDPAVKAKIFDVELFEWYGSAALPMYQKYHEMVQKPKS